MLIQHIYTLSTTQQKNISQDDDTEGSHRDREHNPLFHQIKVTKTLSKEFTRFKTMARSERNRKTEQNRYRNNE